MKKAKSRNPFQRLSNAVKGAVDNLLMDNRDARFSIVTTYIEDLYKHLKHLDGSNQSELKAYRCTRKKAPLNELYMTTDGLCVCSNV